MRFLVQWGKMQPRVTQVMYKSIQIWINGLFPCTYGFVTGSLPNFLFDSTFIFKRIQISDQNSFNFLQPISKYFCKMKLQINSSLLARLMNLNEPFDELSLNLKYVIKCKSISKSHFEWLLDMCSCLFMF